LTDNQTNEPTESLRLLKLLQLADSAVPIGSAAHSFGLETLIVEGTLDASGLANFLLDYLQEAGQVEAAFCRAAHRLWAQADLGACWRDLNARLSARKPAHETRIASLTLGRRLLSLFFALEGGHAPEGDAHHATAFGFVGGVLGVEESLTAAVYLQQIVSGLVSACQRLMPLGQQQAAHLVWDLKPAILKTVAASCALDTHEVDAFMPLVDLASMRHVTLATRLFIS
jgi:urease accessory protein